MASCIQRPPTRAGDLKKHLLAHQVCCCGADEVPSLSATMTIKQLHQRQWGLLGGRCSVHPCNPEPAALALPTPLRQALAARSSLHKPTCNQSAAQNLNLHLPQIPAAPALNPAAIAVRCSLRRQHHPERRPVSALVLR